MFSVSSALQDAIRRTYPPESREPENTDVGVRWVIRNRDRRGRGDMRHRQAASFSQSGLGRATRSTFGHGREETGLHHSFPVSFRDFHLPLLLNAHPEEGSDTEAPVSDSVVPQC